MTAFAGIDYDTRAVHLVVIHEDAGPEYMHLPLGKSEHAFERARDVRDAMPGRTWWDDAGVVAIGLEEQASGNPIMRSTVQKLKMIQGAIISCLPRAMLVMPLEATRWRKEVGMSGKASKDEVAECATRYRLEEAKGRGFGIIDIWPQDASDAYCIALAVQKLTVPA